MSDRMDQASGAYAEPAVLTTAGRFRSQLAGLPGNVTDLAAIAQGLLVHEHLAHLYGVTLSDDDRATVHLRSVEQLLEQVVGRDDRPLSSPRPPDGRVAANCRHFSVLVVAMLRAQGRPARARCGFGGYFVPGRFEDHWVCEYWRPDEERWCRIDAQLDEAHRTVLSLDFDVTDVPHDRFLTAGDAWTRCRAGEADPSTFGLTVIEEAGWWWIAQNLLRDAAALSRVEVLPWDCWGAMPRPEDGLDTFPVDLLDRLAAATVEPGDRFLDATALADDDDGSAWRVPARVFNAVRGQDEDLVLAPAVDG